MARPEQATKRLAFATMANSALVLLIAVAVVNIVYFLLFANAGGHDSSNTLAFQDRSGPVATGGLQCDAATWDFGEIDYKTAGGKLSHQFCITNSSATTQTIAAIRASCGCISLANERKSIAPGHATTLDILVSLPPKPGPFRQILLVDIEGADGPMRLSVCGSVAGVRPLDVAPASLNFGKVPSGETRERIITLLRYQSLDHRSMVARPSHPGLECEIFYGDNDRPKVRVNLLSEALDPGANRLEVVIESRGNDLAKVSVPAIAFIESPSEKLPPNDP